MAGGDVQVKIPNGPAPTAKIIDGTDALIPKSVNATFDGTGAAGDFLPCLVITGKEGFEVARIPAPKVAAGASADVSWFPRVGDNAAAGTGEGIEFTANGVYGPNNTGDALNVTTTVGPIVMDAVFELLAQVASSDTQLILGETDVRLESYQRMTLVSDNGFMHVFAENGDMLFRVLGNPNNIVLRVPVGGAIEFQNNAGAAILRVDENGAGYHIKTGHAWVADL